MSNKRIIPLFDSPNFKQAVILDGINYVLQIVWNTYGQFWGMSIFDGNEALIRAGIRLTPWYPLRAQYNDPRLPPGEFMIVDTSQQANTELGRHDFGTGRNVELWYVGVA